MFDRALIQAVSDWQRGGSPKQKARRGKALKVASAGLPLEFRQTNLACLRQVALQKDTLWRLADELELSETISAWTLSPTIATSFKGGVPPVGYQGVIFAIVPAPDQIVLNVSRLVSDPDFRTAAEGISAEIDGYSEGTGRYGDSQQEIVLELERVRFEQIYQLGGFSSSRSDLMKLYYRREPSPADEAQFDQLVRTAGVEIGPAWIDSDATQRVLTKIERLMPPLRDIKRLQL